MGATDVDANRSAEVAVGVGDCRVEGPNEALGRWGHDRDELHSSCEALEELTLVWSKLRSAATSLVSRSSLSRGMDSPMRAESIRRPRNWRRVLAISSHLLLLTGEAQFVHESD